MPYVTQEARAALDSGERGPATAGELNYALTRVALKYFKESVGRYQDINDVLGALEGAKLEFYRRVAAPYEDRKIKESGDVY